MKNKISNISVYNYVLKIINISLLFFLFIFPCNQQLLSQSNFKKDIKVMSFNIRYGTANDGENSWEFRKKFVFEIIKKYNPDLIGLQEALKFQIDEILIALPEYKFVGNGRDDGKEGGEYSCILYKKKRFAIDSTETFWFSETPDIPGSKHWGNNYTRISTWAKISDRLNKKKYYFFNLHLDHESQPSREKSTELLIKKISGLTEKLPVIISGDFNCGESNAAIKTILRFGFKDTYRLVISSSDNEGTFNDFKGITNGERIDYIFTTNDFRTIEAKIIRDSFNNKFPSDHFPIYSKIRILK
ncbi:MAG: endonuclease/exonuclease/phosphatase family protein [Melioribacteraceae bacterium]|nr:endonuclease/exonuclease/phosphatase family protein [Melioribacteraceae bacterium]